MKKLAIILGPTASGKSALALWLATELKTVILSADSRQMYREMKIGTARPSDEELNRVKHYFVGQLSIADYYNASMFEMEVHDLLEDIFRQHDIVLMAGGSGLYIDAVCKGIDDFPTTDPEVRKAFLELYEREGTEGLRSMLKKLDPEYYATADLKNYKRILKALEVSTMTGKPYSSFLTGKSKDRPYEIVKVGLDIPRDTLYQRINDRTEKMLSDGWLEEARSLYPYRHHNALNTVGYKELFAFIEGKTELDEAVRLIKRNTRHYARRQLSWFARDKRIRWFNPGEEAAILEYIRDCR